MHSTVRRAELTQGCPQTQGNTPLSSSTGNEIRDGEIMLLGLHPTGAGWLGGARLVLLGQGNSPAHVIVRR